MSSYMVDALRFCDWGVLKGALMFCRRTELRVKNRLPESMHLELIWADRRRLDPGNGSRPHEDIEREIMVKRDVLRGQCKWTPTAASSPGSIMSLSHVTQEYPIRWADHVVIIIIVSGQFSATALLKQFCHRTPVLGAVQGFPTRSPSPRLRTFCRISQ